LPAADDPPCSWHHQSDDGLLVVWPPAYRQWARENDLLRDWKPQDSGDLRRTSGSGASQPTASTPAPVRGRLEIVNPPSGATYLIDPTLRREFQTLPLRVVTATPGTIEWQVAGRVVGVISEARSCGHDPGAHRITARRAPGGLRKAQSRDRSWGG
jgi:hypothetical protein